jgi:hypothetical protein
MHIKKLTLLLLLSSTLSVNAADVDVAQTKDIIERSLAGQSTGQDAIRLSFLILNRDGSTQMERAAHFPFYTGEIMRVKVVSGQTGSLQLTNINASGKATPFRTISVQAGVPAYYPPEPGAVLEFANTTGNEVIRVNFIPAASLAPLPSTNNAPPNNGGVVVAAPPVAPYNGGGGGTPVINVTPQPLYAQQPPVVSTLPSRPSEFFSDVQGKAYSYSKDIRELVLETPQATYLTRPSGTGGLSFDVTIQHRNQ